MKSFLEYTIDSPEVKEVIIRDEKLGKLIMLLGDLQLELPTDHFRTLCRNIVGQQLSVKAAATIWGRFEEYCSNLSPEVIINCRDEELRAIGLSRSKVTYIKDLCQKILDKEIILEDLSQHNDEEIILILTKVKGIGKWTAEMFLIFSLGRPDVFSIDDLGLRRAVKWLYELEELPTKKAMLQYGEVWKPHKTVASLYLWEGINQKIIP